MRDCVRLKVTKMHAGMMGNQEPWALSMNRGNVGEASKKPRSMHNILIESKHCSILPRKKENVTPYGLQVTGDWKEKIHSADIIKHVLPSMLCGGFPIQPSFQSLGVS